MQIVPFQFDHEPPGFNWAFLTNSLSNKTKLDLDKSLFLSFMWKHYKILWKNEYWSHKDFEVSNRSVLIYIWILFTKGFVCRSVTWWCFSLTDRNSQYEQVAKLINHQSRPQCMLVLRRRALGSRLNWSRIKASCGKQSSHYDKSILD